MRKILKADVFLIQKYDIFRCLEKEDTRFLEQAHVYL